MLVPNFWELDQLPFLKKSQHQWVSDDNQGQKSKIGLMENLRNLSFQSSKIMSKIFFYNKEIKKDTSQSEQETNQFKYYELLHITTEKQMLSLQSFYYLLQQNTSKQDFSIIVNLIHRFVDKTKKYFKDVIKSKSEIDFGNKQFLTFNIYLQKQHPNSLNFDISQIKQQSDLIKTFMKNNRFVIKSTFTHFDYQPFKQILEHKQKQPQPFVIENQLVITKLVKIYFQLNKNKFQITYKEIKKYSEYFDQHFFLIDQQYLKLQIFKNYPPLRKKFYMPVFFNDFLTNQRLDGPIFSNSDPDCMFNHFIGYNANTIKMLEGSNCSECGLYFDGVQENPILTHLRDNIFNPYKTDVLYCPQYNRFKLIFKVPVQKSQNQQQEQNSQPKQQFKKQIKYFNYLHMRSNLRKMISKKRIKFNEILNEQKFSLLFSFNNRRLLIVDPARGKNCSHYQFTDLRLYYLNKQTQNTYKCPICQQIISDSDILYLKQVQIILKYFRFKTNKFRNLLLNGQFYINHYTKKVFIQYKKKGKQGNVQKQIIQIEKYYQTFIDPYVSFNQWSLGIPDKHTKKMRQKYMFGFDKQNQEDSQDEFDQLFDEAELEKQEKKQKINTTNKTQDSSNTNPQIQKS